MVAIPVFLATVGIDAYGLMVTVMAFSGYLNFADAGLSWGSMILIAQANGRGAKAEIAHVVRHAIMLAAGSGIVVLAVVGAVLLAASRGWRLPMFAHHPEADPLILIAGTQLILTLQFGVFYNLFHGLQQGYWSGLYQGVGRLGGLIAAMIGAWLTHKIAVVMLAQLAATALSGGAAALHAWRLHRWAFQQGSWVDRSQYRVQLGVGGKSFMLQIGRTLSGTAPTLGISSIVGPASVPLYTIPTTLLSLFFTPINSWNASMQSAYGEAWTSGAVDWTRAAFRKSLERALLFGGLGVALFLATGNLFIRLWTHNRVWMDPAMAASVCALVVAAAVITACEYLLTGLNQHRGAALAGLANGVIAVVTIPLCIRWWGLGTIGIGGLVAAAATSGWVLHRQIRSQLGAGCFPNVAFVLRLAVVVGIATAIGHFLGSLVPSGGLESAVLKLVLAATGSLVAFIAAGFILRLYGSDEVASVGRRLRESLAFSTP